jgi:hypothetical protein
MMSPVRRSANERRAAAALAPGVHPAGARVAPAAQQPVVGQHGELEARGDEAVAQAGLDEPQRAVGVPRGLDPREVVAGALALGLRRPGDDRAVARPRELLELGLGLLEVARGGVGGLRAELELLVARHAAQPDHRPALERGVDVVGLDVEVVGVLVVERGADVLPVVAQRGRDVLLGGDQHLRVVGREVEEGVEAVDREDLGDVGALAVLAGRADLRELAVLGGELRGGRDLHPVDLAERALGERRELPERLDLDVEQVDAHGAVRGGREDVEDLAADGELAAVLDLVAADVAHRDELLGDLAEVDQAALLDRERVRAQRRVGDLLAERDGGDDHDRRLLAGLALVEQRVDRGDPQADEVRRRREVRLVGDAAARVEAHGPRRQPRGHVGGEVARLAVVAGDDERRARVGVGQRRREVRAQRLRDERADGRGRVLQGDAVGRVVEVLEQGAEGHRGTPSDRARRPAGRPPTVGSGLAPAGVRWAGATATMLRRCLAVTPLPA